MTGDNSVNSIPLAGYVTLGHLRVMNNFDGRDMLAEASLIKVFEVVNNITYIYETLKGFQETGFFKESIQLTLEELAPGQGCSEKFERAEAKAMEIGKHLKNYTNFWNISYSTNYDQLDIQFDLMNTCHSTPNCAV